MPHHQPFVLFGRSHEIVLALTIVLPILLAILVRVTKSPTLTRLICWAFALAICGIWVIWYVVFFRNGWLNLDNELPMDLCSWAAVATVITLIRPNHKSYELAYFWALAGTLQGLLRPGIPYDFPEFQFVDFTIFHGGIIAAVLFMTLAMKLRPTLSSIPRVIAWSLIYMAVAALVDWQLGVDYGFLRAKPIYPSVYDLMPAWPYYIPVVVALGLLSTAIYYAPFFVFDRVKSLRK